MPEESGPENDMSKELGIPKIEWNQVQKAVTEAERKSAGRESRPVPEIAGGAPGWLVKDVKDLKGLPPELVQKLTGFDRAPDAFLNADRLGNMYFEVLNKIDGKAVTDANVAPFLDAITRKTEAISGTGLRIENTKSPESWVTGILGAINNLEDKATREQKSLESFPEYQAIETTIGAVPEKMAGTMNDQVSRDLGREVYLKEKLELVWAARLRLHNRKTEVVGAGGSLKMLSPSSEVPLGKGVRLEFTAIQPIDLYILVRLDDLFKKEAGGATKEICPPVETAMVKWKEKGESWSESPPPDPKNPNKELPSLAKRVLNSGQEMAILRQEIAGQVGSKKAEQLAFDIFTISLSFDKWDKKLEGQGPYQPRGVIHFDAKRKDDSCKRLQDAGPKTTIGAYFAETSEDADDNKKLQKEKDKLPGQADRAYAEHVIRTKEERLKIVRDNRDRAVFTYSVDDPPKGQLVGDLWDSLNDAQARKSFATLLSEGKSWKDLPYLKLSDTAYVGYFGFALGQASKLEQELTNTTFDPKLLIQPEFWTDKRALVNKLAYFSPSVQEKKDAEQDKKLTEVMRTYCRGILWTGSHLNQSKSGAAADLETLGILKPVETIFNYVSLFIPGATIRQGVFTYELVDQMLNAIQTSRVLPGDELSKLKREIRGYIYSFAPAHR